MATDDKVSVILTSTNTSGAVKQKSFTYISPEATNGQLKAFAQAANALTENTYNGSKKVTQVNLDTADPGGGKQTPTLTLSENSCAFSDLKFSNEASVQFTITTDSDGAIYVKPSQTSNKPVLIGIAADLNTAGTFYASLYKAQSGSIVLSEPQTITIGVAESNTYKAVEVTFTVTA